jgi:hypothetical protein
MVIRKLSNVCVGIVSTYILTGSQTGDIHVVELDYSMPDMETARLLWRLAMS